MKKALSFLGIFLISILFSQKNETYVKANALFAPVGIINVGVEQGLSKQFTAQADVFVSPWKSFSGHKALGGIINLEGRYYFDEAFSKWYLGLTGGFGVFEFQKWNYWNDNFYVDNKGNVTDLINSNLYQKGMAYFFGVSVGYQFKLSDRWKLDIFGSFGIIQSYYKGYQRGLPETQEYRYDKVENWDISTEYLPYRGGIMFSYKL